MFFNSKPESSKIDRSAGIFWSGLLLGTAVFLAFLPDEPNGSAPAQESMTVVNATSPDSSWTPAEPVRRDLEQEVRQLREDLGVLRSELRQLKQESLAR